MVVANVFLYTDLCNAFWFSRELFQNGYSTMWYILRADILRVVQDFFKPSISDEKKRAISLFSILILVFEIPPTALFVDRIDCIMSSLKDENNANETIKVFFVTSWKNCCAQKFVSLKVKLKKPKTKEKPKFCIS